MDKIHLLYSISHWMYKHHLSLLSVVLGFFMRVIFSCHIPYKTTIGKGTTFPHYALGCLFHPNVVIGQNCKILVGVLIGGKSNSDKLPVIGNNVMIGAHAIILGNVHVGDNSIIGAGSVVLKDVPENCVVAGNPAKIIKYLQ